MANVRTILFASILGLVCALLLVAANLVTSPYRRANERAEEIQNLLFALEVPVDEQADSKSLLKLFNTYVRVMNRGELTFYEYVPTEAPLNEPIAVAVPFSGAGLWGPIKGVIALEPDLMTIRGVRFYQQEETPGLGGEIGSDWFQKQFNGKKIVSSSGNPEFRIVKPGATTNQNSVNAITGATMTSDRIQTILDNMAIKLSKVRSHNVK
jgi:Na+-transporting NADH:ubiquinone oxidoreductase subunit C